MKVGDETKKRWGWFIAMIALVVALSPILGWTILSGIVLGGVMLLLAGTIASESRKAKKQVKNIMYALSAVLALAGIAAVMAVEVPVNLVAFVSGLQVIGGLTTLWVIYT